MLLTSTYTISLIELGIFCFRGTRSVVLRRFILLSNMFHVRSMPKRSPKEQTIGHDWSSWCTGLWWPLILWCDCLILLHFCLPFVNLLKCKLYVWCIASCIKECIWFLSCTCASYVYYLIVFSQCIKFSYMPLLSSLVYLSVSVHFLM